MRRRSESTMDAAVMMETCPDSETLAAFSDGALDTRERLEVVQHVADCGQCQHELVELDAARRELQLEPANVTRGPFGWRWLGPLVAAAAVVVVVFGVPSIRQRIFGGDPMGKLVEAANQAPKRSTEARLSGEFSYRAYERLRGANDGTAVSTNTDAERAKVLIEIAALEAAEQATKRPNAARLHADGVGKLLEKTPAAALPVLERAAAANPRSVPILTDLSVAYLEHGDYEKALATATKAWNIEHTQAAAWNRALALGRLAIIAPARKAEAIDAWGKYLELDPSSEWAAEVRTKHLRDLLPEN